MTGRWGPVLLFTRVADSFQNLRLLPTYTARAPDHPLPAGKAPSWRRKTMKKICLMLLSAALTLGVVLTWTTGSADARPNYDKVFVEKYGKELKEGIEKVGEKNDEGKVTHCNICHVAGKKKDQRNAYGQELAKGGLKKETDAAKIKAAFEKAESSHSKAGDDKSPTFGELIKAGKLPGA